MSTEDIIRATRLLDNEIRILKALPVNLSVSLSIVSILLVKAMEVDEKPTEDYNDIGGLEKQIQELVEAIVLPMTHKERFEKLGVRPPKGVLLYGPPGSLVKLSWPVLVRRRPMPPSSNWQALNLSRCSLETELNLSVMPFNLQKIKPW
ncbi:unnamed protein product [Cochlearia groenlandica]